MKNWKITHTIMITVMMLMAFVIAGSGKSREDQQFEYDAQNQEIFEDKSKMANKEIGKINKNEGLQAILNHYMQIKSALVADKSEQAQKAAASLQETVKETDRDELGEELKNTVSQLAEAQDISSQRKYFAQLSDQFYQLVKNSDAVDQELYWQFCPMALNNQGANWLSYEEQVQNPFMGKKMPTCGSVEETIN